ncbi:MAG: hypothetical protein NDI69_02490 [Bacteriovoracaceae bacterium]|nr:hypothetical protein [Bacteriovoracaceae bacterium]
MRLLKIILVIFLIYFIRRFIQMYRVMKTIRDNQELNPGPKRPTPEKRTDSKNDKIVDADFKVMD